MANDECISHSWHSSSDTNDCQQKHGNGYRGFVVTLPSAAPFVGMQTVGVASNHHPLGPAG